MTTATTVDISTLLYTLPSPSGGRLCLSGSGVSVRQVSILYNEGLSPEEIQAEYPHLTMPAIYAAITYYLANKAKMDAELEEDIREGERLRDFYEKHGHFPPFDEK
jgi:uncharacterized protein (DUF433 family)